MGSIFPKRYGWTLGEGVVDAANETEAARLLAETSLSDFNEGRETNTKISVGDLKRVNMNDWLAHYIVPLTDGQSSQFVRKFKVFDIT